MLPLFFIPAKQAMNRDLAREHGLDRIFEDGYAHQFTTGGPNGQSGIVVASNDTPPDRMRVELANQTWSKRYGYTSLIGTWNDAPPTIDELKRPQQLDGQTVELLDGCRWTVPILRAWREGDSIEWEARLPRVLEQCADTGKWIVTAVVPQYRALWDKSIDIADKLFDQLRGKETAELEWSDLFEFAVLVLQVNYRVDASILSHLKILAPDLAGEIVRAALDWSTLRANLKNALSRRTSDGTNTASGSTPPIAD